MSAILKPIVEHFVIDLIHNVKILLNETIKAMAHTKQFKRFVEKLFLLSANVSLESTINEMKSIIKPKPISGSDSAKFGDFLKGVKGKIAASTPPSASLGALGALAPGASPLGNLQKSLSMSALPGKSGDLGAVAMGALAKNPKLALSALDLAAKNPKLLSGAITGNSDDMAKGLVNFMSDPNSLKNVASVGAAFEKDNPELAKQMFQTGVQARKGAQQGFKALGMQSRILGVNGGAEPPVQKGGFFSSSKTVDAMPPPPPIDTTTKYVLEPHIFPTLPDITPEKIKKFFYSPIEPFLQVITCKNCNNGMFVRMKNKIICNLMKLVTVMITLLIKTGVFNSTVIYGSFKKALDRLAANPRNLEGGGKIPQLIAIFEEQLLRNEKRLTQIEEEEKNEFEDLTGAEAHEKLLQKKLEERNRTIDEVSAMLESAVREIKEDEYLPGKDRRPDDVRAKLATMLGDIDAKGAQIQSTIKNEIPPEYAAKIASAKKNEELKKRANVLIRELRTLKSLPYYDESAEYKDPTLDPAPRVAKIARELAGIRAELGGPAVDKQKRGIISGVKNVASRAASGVKNVASRAASGVSNIASRVGNSAKRMLGYKGGRGKRRTFRHRRQI